jgi:hypothetical protein
MDVLRTGAWLLLIGLVAGCASPLDSARSDFYAGRLDSAEKSLAESPVPDVDRVLFLMERGMVRQARGDYAQSSRDFIDAADELEVLETYSVTQGAASLVVNDTVQAFQGAPFERALLHAFTAKNHLAQGLWDNGAVEARRIIDTLAPRQRGDYPEDAYSRYMAGLCLEMIDDRSNASIQYRRASELSSEVSVDDRGWLAIKTTNPVARGSNPWPTPASGAGHELVCFTLAGRGPSAWDTANGYHTASGPVYAEIHSGGKVLGRSYVLADTARLAFLTDQLAAATRAAKAATRIYIKDQIADAVEQNNDALGELVRFILLGVLEQPDQRRWETLPRWLGVARVACPPNLREFDVVFKTEAGSPQGSVHVTQPIMSRRNISVSFCRDSAVTP